MNTATFTKQDAIAEAQKNANDSGSPWTVIHDGTAHAVTHNGPIPPHVPITTVFPSHWTNDRCTSWLWMDHVRRGGD